MPDYHVRTITLPSGKAIEIVYFDRARPAGTSTPAMSARPAAPARMHVCGACTSPLVQPVAWSETGDERWKIQLRCPECEHRRTGEFGRADVEAYDAHLNRGTQAVAAELRRVASDRFAEEVDRFVCALRDDLILPVDF